MLMYLPSKIVCHFFEQQEEMSVKLTSNENEGRTEAVELYNWSFFITAPTKTL